MALAHLTRRRSPISISPGMGIFIMRRLLLVVLLGFFGLWVGLVPQSGGTGQWLGIVLVAVRQRSANRSANPS